MPVWLIRAGSHGEYEQEFIAAAGARDLSPAFLGMSDGAMTSQSTPSLVSCQYKA
jgi:hypothetical protein